MIHTICTQSQNYGGKRELLHHNFDSVYRMSHQKKDAINSARGVLDHTKLKPIILCPPPSPPTPVFKINCSWCFSVSSKPQNLKKSKQALSHVTSTEDILFHWNISASFMFCLFSLFVFFFRTVGGGWGALPLCRPIPNWEFIYKNKWPPALGFRLPKSIDPGSKFCASCLGM